MKIGEPNDPTELEAVRAALYLANERLAIASSISQDALLGTMPDGEITTWNRAAERLFGYTAHEATGQNIAMLLSADSQFEQLEFLSRVCAGEILGPEDTKRLRKDGTLLDVSISAAPIKSVDGTVIGVSFAMQDISRRKEWDTKQRLMTRELTHRVKNSFAILQSILHSTLKNSPEPKEFAKVFSGRLHSLAAAQDVLTANDWRGIELGTLARHQLASYDKLDNVKLRIAGPEVYLAPHYATPFGLIFNELAANAYEHGAWSSAKGKVDLNWRIEHNEDAASKLFVSWQERGGPKPSSHRTPGLGVVLIEKSLAGAQVINMYEAHGLTCTIELEIAQHASMEQVEI
jgi:two-component system, chemotaxis family, CheB/CheR fusion protein